MKPLLEIKNLNINYKNSIKAVKNVSLTLEDNQIISIVGESGSGKSTLIRAILKRWKNRKWEYLFFRERYSYFK